MGLRHRRLGPGPHWQSGTAAARAPESLGKVSEDVAEGGNGALADRRGRGPTRVRAAARTVRRGDTTIELTPREFSLLEFLMRRAGDAVSKADILHHVWDANYDGDANVVEVYVGYLRRKIDTPFGRQSLQTVRGAGYRLTADGG